jgi:hypothetical protein
MKHQSRWSNYTATWLLVAVIRDVISKLNRRRLQLHSDVVRDVLDKLNLREFNYLSLA